MAQRQKIYKYLTVALLLTGATLLFFAQSAYWVNHTIFNQENFSHITTTALESQSSRDAIATSVVNTALENRPILQKTIGSRAISLTSGLLGSDLGSQAISAITEKTYAYATAKDREDIKINLQAVKSSLSRIISLVQGDDVQSALSQYKIPDEIVLLRSNAFPDLSGAVQLMLWIGPLLWLGAIGLLALYVYLGRDKYAKQVYVVGAAIIVVCFIGLATRPFIPPPVAAAVPSIALRPVAENITVGFLTPFQTQMYWMLGFTLVALLVFNQRFNILSLLKSFATKVGPQEKAESTSRSKTKKAKVASK